MNLDGNIVYLQEHKDVRCPKCENLILKVSEDTTGNLIVYCRKCKKEFSLSLRDSRPLSPK